MQITRPSFKYEFNLTTISTLVGLIVLGAGYVWSASNMTTNFQAQLNAMDSKFTTWIANHEQLHKDRASAISGDQARTDQRLTNMENQSGKWDNLAYRMTVQEQGSANLSKAVEELKNAVNGQAADIRVMLEIVRRLDPLTKGAIVNNGQ